MTDTAIFNKDIAEKVKANISEYHQTLFARHRYEFARDIWVATDIPHLMAFDTPSYLGSTIWFPTSYAGYEMLDVASKQCDIRYQGEGDNPWIVAGGVMMLRKPLPNPWDITEWVSHSKFWCLYHDFTKQVFVPHNWQWVDYSEKMYPEKKKWFTEIYSIWRKAHGLE